MNDCGNPQCTNPDCLGLAGGGCPDATPDGDTFVPERDQQRLGKLHDRVLAVMSDHQWHLVPDVQARVGGTETSVSARIRDLRKEKFGGHTVEAECVRKGLWRYRLMPRPTDAYSQLKQRLLSR